MSGKPKRLVIPEWCAPLNEEIISTTPAHVPCATPHNLPPDFPSDCLDDEQLDLVDAWFDRWLTGRMDTLRTYLAPSAHDKMPPLKKLWLKCLVVCQRLRLSPVADIPLRRLAQEDGVACGIAELVRLSRAFDNAFAAAQPNETERLTSFFCAVAREFPELDFSGRIGRNAMDGYLIPYRGHFPLPVRGEVARRLAAKRRDLIVSPEHLMPDGITDAVRVRLFF